MSVSRAKKKNKEREIKKEVKKYVLTNREIETIKKDATDEAVQNAFALMLGIPLMVLRDKYGYGKKRLNRFADEIQETWDSYMKEYFEIEDVWQVLKEEVGMTRERIK